MTRLLTNHRLCAVAVLAAVVLSTAAVRAAELRELAEEYLAAKAELKKAPRKDRDKLVSKKLKPALVAIASLDTEESLRFVVKEFQGPDPGISRAAVDAVLATTDERAIGMLATAYDKRPAVVRKEILQQLAKTKRPLEPAAKPLLGLLRTERQNDLRALLPAVIGRLDTAEAAQALIGEVGRTKGPGAGDYDVAVVRVLARTKNQEVKDWIATGAFRKAPATRLKVLCGLAGELKLAAARDRLVDLLEHKDDAVAAEAVAALRLVGVGDAAARVSAALEKGSRRSTEFKIQALDTLATAGDTALRAVVEAARGGDVETRTIAMGSLARQHKSQIALEGVLGGLKDSSPQVRAAAVRALGRFRSKAMVGGLIDLISSERVEKLRVDALRLLVETTGKNMGLEVEDWRKWWEVAGAKFEFPGKDGFTNVKAYDLEYFGIEVASSRVAFLVDNSGSMREMVKVRVRREEKKEKKPDGDEPSGRTRRVPGSEEGQEKGKENGKGKKKDDGPTVQKPKLEVLKKELTRVLEALPESANINIVSFDATPKSWKKKLHSLAGSGRKQAIQFVRGLTNGSGTNVYDTLELALKDKRVDTIFLLTDGKPTRGKYTDSATILRKIGAMNRIRGATIHCIAFGEESDLLKKLAAANDGEYRYVDTY